MITEKGIDEFEDIKSRLFILKAEFSRLRKVVNKMAKSLAINTIAWEAKEISIKNTELKDKNDLPLTLNGANKT